jgi:hypothetical protein
MNMRCISVLLTLLVVYCARLNGGEPTAAPEGVTTSVGMKPFAWPKELVRLEFGHKTRYRNTGYYLRPYLYDGMARLQLIQDEKVLSDLILFDCGQFAILDVDSPLPVLQAWGERFDNLAGRHLLIPVRNGERAQLRICYTEVYTPTKGDALSSEGQEIQLRPEGIKKEVYFLGHLSTTEPKEAEEGLKRAREFRWESSSDRTNQMQRTRR